MNKLFVVVLAIIIVSGGAYYFLGTGVNDDQGNGLEEEADTPNIYGMPAPLEGEASLTGRAEENMVVVSEQRPGANITGSLIVLAAPGYLVIHEDTNGEPGAILGTSALVRAGENTNVQVKLSRPARDKETLHAMLHFEKGGNTAFAATEDTPVPSSLGGPISGWFLISSEASMDLPVSM